MIVSVLEAGFLCQWRVPLAVRVPQGPGPAARHEAITSAPSLSVLQVRMAGPGCLTDGPVMVEPKEVVDRGGQHDELHSREY
jgi:hypothetical protein